MKPAIERVFKSRILVIVLQLILLLGHSVSYAGGACSEDSVIYPSRTVSLREIRVIDYLQRHWEALEINLVSGGGDTLRQLNGLAKCDYAVEAGYWGTRIKGKPYELRVDIFQADYFQECACTPEP